MENGFEPTTEAVARQDALIAANLFEADPETISGLVFPIPPNEKLKALLSDYDTQRTTGRKVRCAVCPTHTQHYKGFVGQLDDGRLFLIGINCGENRFGEGVWAEMSASLKRQQDEAHYRSRIEPALRQVATVYPLLQGWRERIKFWQEFRSKLSSRCPDLFKELREAALTAEGRLEREEFKTITVVDQQGNPRLKRVAQPLYFGRIPYPAGFVSAPGERALNNAIEHLKSANGILSSPSNMQSLERAFRALRDGLMSVEAVEAYHQGWIDNASIAWWTEACNWFNFNRSAGFLSMKGHVLWRHGTPVVEVPASTPSESPFQHIASAWPR